MSRNIVKSVSAEQKVFGKLVGYPEWVANEHKLEALRVDHFELVFLGNTEPSRLLKGISSGMARYIAREAEDLYALTAGSHSVSIYEMKPPKLAVSAINLDFHEGEDSQPYVSSVVTLELKNLGTEQTNARIHKMVSDVLFSVQKMNNAELEHFLDSGEMLSLKR